ncbi:MAG: flagellar assembly protein [Bdellovibrionaceae bacterium]|nr:flagellar assembly protein [Bdellovibrio sp.]
MKMRWSNVLKKLEDNKAPTDVSVLDYVPKQFDFGTPAAAVDYLKQKERGSDFLLSEVLRTTTGVEEIERLSEEQKVEQKVLDKLALLQEEAYKKAYELGRDEGFKQAHQEKTSELNDRTEEIYKLTESINHIKEELIYQNEAHIMRLIYDIACKVAFDHIEQNPDSVLKVIKAAIETAQVEEHVSVLINPGQLEFLEQMQKNPMRENEFMKNIKFVDSDQVTPGSCIVETNYGVIDARIEERVHKLWTELKEALPKVKSPIGNP